MTTKITSEYGQAVFNLPWLVAQDEGLFAKEGIEVVFVRSRERDASEAPIADPQQIDPFWRHKPFEENAAEFFNACEWGQIRRSNDSKVGGRIVMLRAAMANQVIFVRGDSQLTHPQMLRNRTIAVNFHAGSHYLTLQLLEGFMARGEIRPVHHGQARLRYQALMAQQFQKLQAGYRFQIVDGNLSSDEVFAELQRKVQLVLAGRHA